MTPTEAGQLLALTARLWPTSRIPVDNLTVAVWAQLLEHTDYTAAKEWLVTHSVGSDFPPRPAQIAVGAAAAPVDSIEAVWTKCMEFCRLSGFPGRDDHPLPDDHSIAADVFRRAGGYRTVNDATWGRREVEKAYKAIVAERGTEKAHHQAQQIMGGNHGQLESGA